jgi:hypothetical protein
MGSCETLGIKPKAGEQMGEQIDNPTQETQYPCGLQDIIGETPLLQ